MSNVRMKANDTLHVSAVGPNNIQAGETFEVNSVFADDLEKRGLAKRVGGAKAEAAPQNKAEAAPANKRTGPVQPGERGEDVDTRPVEATRGTERGGGEPVVRATSAKKADR